MPTLQTQFLPLLRLPSISQLLFLSRGVPDILIQRKAVVAVGQGVVEQDDCQTSEDKVVENSHQRPPLGGLDGVSPPEK